MAGNGHCFSCEGQRAALLFPPGQGAQTLVQHGVGIAAKLHQGHIALPALAAQKRRFALFQPKHRAHRAQGAVILLTKAVDTSALAQVVVDAASIGQKAVVRHCQQRQIAGRRRSAHRFQQGQRLGKDLIR